MNLEILFRIADAGDVELEFAHKLVDDIYQLSRSTDPADRVHLFESLLELHAALRNAAEAPRTAAWEFIRARERRPAVCPAASPEETHDPAVCETCLSAAA